MASELRARRGRMARSAAVICLAASSYAMAAGDERQVAAAGNIADLSLEELRDVVIQSVSRRSQPLLDAPASVYVISGDDIRRSGVTTLPEALRMAPNLQVAAIDSRQYAISARGFNGNVSNKLLVMVDGRTVYSPLFSGVFWDAQDFVAADIDHIEVISGPSGATWGTNAVNGVINVVTLSAAKTQGTSVAATWGSRDKTVAGRYGFNVSDEVAVRAHVMSFDRGPSELRGGGYESDAAKGTTAGVRADWTRGDDSVMVKAGLFRSTTDDRPVYGSVDLTGSNVTALWSRRLSESSDFDLQMYYDSTHRKDLFLLQENAHVFDVEGKYRLAVGSHRLLAGIGYRRADDSSEPGLIFAFFPPDKQLDYYSGFVQDEVSISAKLVITLGMRMEHNPYTGWESLPSIRAGYKLNDDSLAWAAVSRAVRSPARFDREIFAPTKPPFFIAGGPDFQSEIANVAELGYRTQLSADAAISATAFVQDYARLRSGEVVGQSLVIENKIAGQIRGLETWGNWRPMSNWRLDAGLLWLNERLHRKANSNDPVGPSNLGNDPHVQWSLRSTHNVGERIDFGVTLRHVGALPSPKIPSYTATDFTLNWRPSKSLQVSAGVRNAFDPGHAEYQGFSTVSEIPRSAFVALTYQPH